MMALLLLRLRPPRGFTSSSTVTVTLRRAIDDSNLSHSSGNISPFYTGSATQRKPSANTNPLIERPMCVAVSHALHCTRNAASVAVFCLSSYSPNFMAGQRVAVYQ